MSLHINRFMDRITTAESRQQRDVVISVKDARALHTEITRLLLLVEELRSQLDQNTTTDTIVVQGADF